jgi:hypothetical protein
VAGALEGVESLVDKAVTAGIKAGNNLKDQV